MIEVLLFILLVLLLLGFLPRVGAPHNVLTIVLVVVLVLLVIRVV